MAEALRYCERTGARIDPGATYATNQAGAIWSSEAFHQASAEERKAAGMYLVEHPTPAFRPKRTTRLMAAMQLDARGFDRTPSGRVAQVRGAPVAESGSAETQEKRHRSGAHRLARRRHQMANGGTGRSLLLIVLAVALLAIVAVVAISLGR